MFGTIKGLIPAPRQADQPPRHYIGRHRYADTPGTAQDAPATEADPDAPTRELAAAAAAVTSPEPDAGNDPRP